MENDDERASATASPSRTVDPQHLGFDLSIDSKTLSQVFERFTRVLRSTIADELSRFEARQPPNSIPRSEPLGTSKPNSESSRGICVSAAEKLKAADLRTAVLMGKVPNDTSLLIDTKATARLLNVSSRTLYRLDQLQAIPAPVRIGGRLIRWRLTEILEWIDSNCPPRKSWCYPSHHTSPKKAGLRL